MPLLQLVYAPNPIFKQKISKVEVFDDALRATVRDMLETLYVEKAAGIGANMVGILKRIAIVDLHKDDQSNPYTFINPEIEVLSKETQTFEEASLSYPGISAEVTRPKHIKICYQDENGAEKSLEAEGFFATVIQHEVDYLNGKVYLDCLSKMKRDRLLKKMDKHLKLNPPHVHGTHCSHG
jgi:peptide deformylase